MAADPGKGPAPDLVELTVGDVRYRIALPDRGSDYIQGRIAAELVPYEAEMLADLAGRLTAGDVVIDVGANIGNHTLYLAAVAGCRVEAFEPDRGLTAALARSVAANGFEALVGVHPRAVGAARGAGSLVAVDPTNRGRQRVDVGAAGGAGDVEVVALDDLDLPRPVRALKVDVEGMELDVLRGAQRLLAADGPVIYVECATEAAFGAVAAWLDDRGYAYWDTFNATPTHLFRPAAGIDPEHLARRLLLKTVRDGYRSADVVRGLRGRLDDANLKYRTATASVEALRRELADTTATLTQARADAESARTDVESARTDAESARADVESARTDAESARADAESARADAESARADVESARTDVESARAEVESARAEADSARADAAQARERAAAAQAALAAAGQAHAAELTRLEVATAAAQDRAREQAAAAQRARDDLAEAREQVASGQRELESAQRKLESAQRERQSAQRERQSAQRERQAAQRELESAQRERESAQRERESAQRELESERAQWASEAAQWASEAAQWASRSEESAGYLVRWEQAGELAARRLGELDTVRAEAVRLRAELAATAERAVALDRRAAELAASTESAWAQVGALAAERAEAVAAQEALRAEIDAGRTKLAGALARHRTALDRLATAQGQVRAAQAAERSARQEALAVRSSATFRAGRELYRARRSPLAALALPVRLWRIRGIVAPRIVEGTVEGTTVAPALPTARPTPRPPVPSTAPSTASSTAPAAHPGPAPAPEPVAAQAPWRVAAVVDEFTGLSLAPDCDLLHLAPQGWQEALEAFAPEVLFVESAWRGVDGAWHNAVSRYPAALRGIVEWCRAHGVPTVFWNKEDPVHFATFLTTASAFDHVFTTDVDCIARYRAALGHDRVHLLPFAAQPRHHHPVQEAPRKDAFSFAGAYYRRYPERTRVLDDFLATLPGWRPLEIFDRNLGSDDEDYAFPPQYRPFVVGTLAPQEIAAAYKGYRYGVNLNSVTQSQTMFARRVVELLASNTVVVSNFSRGVRTLLGDLVVTTDSGAEAVRRLRELDADPDGVDRLRLAGLRAVMSAHTYADRLALVRAVVTGTSLTGRAPTTPAVALPEVVLLAAARTAQDVEAVAALVARQEGVRVRGVVVVEDDVPHVVNPALTLLHRAALGRRTVADVAGAAGLVGVVLPQDHHGPHYALDLALGTRYSAADVFGKQERFRLDGVAVEHVDAGAGYRLVASLPVRSSLARTSAVAQTCVAELLEAAVDGRHHSALSQLALDRFSFCENGSGADPVLLDRVDGRPVPWSGTALAELELLAGRTPVAPPHADALPDDGTAGPRDEQPETLTAAWLAELFARARRPALTLAAAPGGLRVESELADGAHDYLYAPREVDLVELWPHGPALAHLDATPGLDVQVVFVLLGSDGERLATLFAVPRRDARLELPAGAVRARIGLRVLGPGVCVVREVVLGSVTEQPDALAPLGSPLVVTNHYPSYDALYRNAFVHARVRGYAERGVRAEVFRLRPADGVAFGEFEGVDVVTGGPEVLRAVLAGDPTAGACPRTLAVHFLDRPLWDLLRRSDPATRVVVWAHGVDVQPWWRRPLPDDSAEALEAAKIASADRLDLWREVLTSDRPGLHVVFVSDWLATTTAQDVGVTLDPARFSVVPNPIDTRAFAYRPKGVEQRLRILSIRPYASPIYANDLTVEAIGLLREQPGFVDLRFTLVGDGPLFDETVAPVRDLPNVTVRRTFLRRSEIAELHREHGVFLVPTRADTHGVSRDEAMASGLVPVTTDVAAVPEFVDDRCGLLCPPEDAQGLAEAVLRLRDDPDLFARLSAAAADRVRRQAGADVVLARELTLLSGQPGPAARR